jgi:N-glycosylase/DNA lyase
MQESLRETPTHRSADMELRERPADFASIYWEKAWEVAAPHYPGPRDGSFASEEELRAELLFCLLGGHGVSYELNLSVADRLWTRGLFRKPRRLQRRSIEAELKKPQFEPRRRDGNLRRYRFPVRKAELLFSAQLWLEHAGPLASQISTIVSELDRRRFLCSCPGLGPKSASWLLRNSGYARELAVLDVHVLRAMQACGRIEKADLSRDYEAVESEYLSWCQDYDADPARFDLIVWDFSRSRR